MIYTEISTATQLLPLRYWQPTCKVLSVRNTSSEGKEKTLDDVDFHLLLRVCDPLESFEVPRADAGAAWVEEARPGFVGARWSPVEFEITVKLVGPVVGKSCEMTRGTFVFV